MYIESDDNRFTGEPGISDGTVIGPSTIIHGKGHPVTVFLNNPGGAKVVMQSRRTPTRDYVDEPWYNIRDVIDHSNQCMNWLQQGMDYRAMILEPGETGSKVTFNIRSWRHNHDSTFNHEVQAQIQSNHDHYSVAGFCGTCECVHCPATGGSPPSGSHYTENCVGRYEASENNVNVLCDSQNPNIYYLVGSVVDTQTGNESPYHYIMPAGTKVQGLPPNTAMVCAGGDAQSDNCYTWAEASQFSGGNPKQFIVDDPNQANCIYLGWWLWLQNGPNGPGYYRLMSNDGLDCSGNGNGGSGSSTGCSIQITQPGTTITGTTAGIPNGRQVNININGTAYPATVTNGQFSVTPSAADAQAADTQTLNAFVSDGAGCNADVNFVFTNNGSTSSGGTGGNTGGNCSGVSITVSSTGPQVSGSTTGIPAGREVYIALASGYYATVQADGTWTTATSAISGPITTGDGNAANGQPFQAYVEDGGGCNASFDFIYDTSGNTAGGTGGNTGGNGGGNGGNTTSNCDVQINIVTSASGTISGTITGASLAAFVGRSVFVNIGATGLSSTNVDASGNWTITVPASQGSVSYNAYIDDNGSPLCSTNELGNYTA